MTEPNSPPPAAAAAAASAATAALKDFFSGAMGGVAQVLIGQPFDIVKVRLQTSTTYTSALDAAKKIYTQEGPLAFYKGTLTPLVGIGACVSIQFGAFNAARRRLERFNSKHHPLRKDLTYSQYYISGAAAGVANSVISGPIEHIRIRLQTQPSGSQRLYSGPIDCIKKLISHPGGGVARGLYRGEAITILREAQAFGLWFLTFEYLMNRECDNWGRGNPTEGEKGEKGRREDVPAWKIAAYGGIAGEVLWLGSYPLDVVKSKLQSDGFGGEARYKGTMDCVLKTWRGEGMGGFWRGLGPTLLRAMPVSAGTFFVVEMTMRAIS